MNRLGPLALVMLAYFTGVWATTYRHPLTTLGAVIVMFYVGWRAASIQSRP